MTMLSGSRPLPGRGGPQGDAVATVADVAAVVRRSNHATAFAAWTVTTITMGLVIQYHTVREVGALPDVLILITLLVPVLSATVRVLVLLARAGRVGAAVGGELLQLTGAAADRSPQPAAAAPRTPAEAWDRLRALVTIAQAREVLARSALTWAYGSGAAFLGWSLLAGVLAAGS